MIFLLIILSVVSMVILVQDIANRSISWITLPLVAACLLGLRWQHVTGTDLMLQMGQNTILMLALVGFLCIYFYLRMGKKKNPINKAIGTGDIGYFIAITPACEPNIYLWIITAGSFAGLAWLSFMYLVGFPQRSVPLAGMMAFLVMLMQWYVFLFIEGYQFQQILSS